MNERETKTDTRVRPGTAVVVTVNTGGGRMMDFVTCDAFPDVEFIVTDECVSVVPRGKGADLDWDEDDTIGVVWSFACGGIIDSSVANGDVVRFMIQYQKERVGAPTGVIVDRTREEAAFVYATSVEQSRVEEDGLYLRIELRDGQVFKMFHRHTVKTKKGDFAPMPGTGVNIEETWGG